MNSKQIFLIISIVIMVGVGIYFQMLVLAILGVFMFSRIRLLKSLAELRKKISVYKIPLVRTYEELSDKEYWTIRKEYLINSKLSKMIDPNEYNISQFEDKIATSVRNILITPIEKDISLIGKLSLLILWAGSLIIPIWYAIPYFIKIFTQN